MHDTFCIHRLRLRQWNNNDGAGLYAPYLFEACMNRKTYKSGEKGHTFVKLRHDIMDSCAYQALKPADRAVYVEIIRRYKGFNNGDIALSCREAAERCGIGKGTASRSFERLIQCGFIKVGEDAAFNTKGKRSRRWILTHEMLDNKPATNEWKKIDNLT